MLTQEEVWRPVEGLPGLYDVSSLGRIRSLDRIVRCGYGATRLFTGRVLHLTTNARGYLRCAVGKNNQFKTREVHRIVAKAFVPPISGKQVVNHKDGCKTNNQPGNLEWVTQRENNQHAQDKGLNRARFSEKQKQAARRNLALTPSHGEKSC